MITIYHNPRCSKSRQGLALLEASGKKYQTITYLTNNLTVKELKQIIKLLNIKPINLVRKNETIWKEKFKSLTLTDKDIIEAMVKYPKLIERPIIVNKDTAVIGRPTEIINTII